MTRRQQVAEDLRRRIEEEEFKVGDKLPGVFEIARHYGCSIEVARRALWILHAQGWVGEPRQGLYTRVVAKPEHAQPNPRELLAELQETVQSLGVKLEALAAALPTG